jgi:cytochrome oxidase Cu insertion factor (SCO1/SenC/PrrC family)
LDNYHELLGILEKIKKDDLGKINISLNELRDKTKEFLDEYHREKKNGIIDVDELTNLEARRKLAEDLSEEKLTNSQLRNVVLTIENLEDKIIKYRQGTLNEEKAERINQQPENKLIINPLAEQVDDYQEESSQQITEETPLLEARQEVRIEIIK